MFESIRKMIEFVYANPTSIFVVLTFLFAGLTGYVYVSADTANKELYNKIDGMTKTIIETTAEVAGLKSTVKNMNEIISLKVQMCEASKVTRED